MTVEPQTRDPITPPGLNLGGGVAGDLDLLVYLYSRPGFLLSRVEQAIQTLFAASDCGAEVTPLQVQFITLAARLGATDQATLSRWAEIDTSTAALVIRNLLKAGYVERTVATADRRRKLITATEVGTALLDRARSALMAIDERLLTTGGTERDRFVDSLKKLIASAGSPEPELDRAPQLRLMLEAPAYLVRRALQVSEAAFARDASHFDLTVRQFGALMTIFAHPGISQVGMARVIGFGMTTSGVVLGILIKKGLAISQPDPADRRRNRHRLTPAGLARLKASTPAMVRAEAAMMALLTSTARLDLERALGRIVLSHNGLLTHPLPDLERVVLDPRWPVEVTALQTLMGGALGRG